MWLADTDRGLDGPTFSGERARCPGCHESVTGKYGELVAPHWAHLSGADCDTWSEPMTEWHRNWQAAVPAYRREVPFGRHRADAVTADGRIYEFQHSALDPRELADREDFYRGDLVWLWDTRDAYAEGRIEIRLDRQRQRPDERIDHRSVAFHWPRSRYSIGLCNRVVLMDLGRWVLGVDRHNRTMSWGLGHLWEPAVLKARLATEGPSERRYPTCADEAARTRLTPPPDLELQAVQPRPCCICRSGTVSTNPYGQPQCEGCATYATREEMASCHVCGLPLLYEDAAIDGCHATCLPEEAS